MKIKNGRNKFFNRYRDMQSKIKEAKKQNKMECK